MHTPVFKEEVINTLQVTSIGRYIDATAGEGGYIVEIAEKGGHVLGIDWDADQIRNLGQKLREYQTVTLANGNFASIRELAQQHKFVPVDGIIFDFGLSMRQITQSGRGFSYNKHHEPLDMRLNRGTTQSVSDIVTSYTEQQIYDVLSKYSEELNSRAIAQAIVRRRRVTSVSTVQDLVDAVEEGVPKNGFYGKQRDMILARVFQAFRIEVNKEFENIQQGLEGGLDLLKEGGVMVIITFHSLEDRLVKNLCRKHNWNVRRIKPTAPKHAFERSAQMRVVTK